MVPVRRDIPIEDLVTELPESIGYLMNHGIRCMACGEPLWGTLEEAAREKGFSEMEIDTFVADLNRYTVSRSTA